MPENKTYRVAVGSSDGKVVNEHFGKAESFLIFDLKGEDCLFVEKRPVLPPCGEEGHTEDGLKASVDALSDCAAVLVAKIGPPARRELEISGVSVFEHPALINGALEKLAAYYRKQALARWA